MIVAVLLSMGLCRLTIQGTCRRNAASTKNGRHGSHGGLRFRQLDADQAVVELTIARQLDAVTRTAGGACVMARGGHLLARAWAASTSAAFSFGSHIRSRNRSARVV